MAIRKHMLVAPSGHVLTRNEPQGRVGIFQPMLQAIWLVIKIIFFASFFVFFEVGREVDVILRPQLGVELPKHSLWAEERGSGGC